MPLTPRLTSAARARHRPAAVPGTGTGFAGPDADAEAEADGAVLAGAECEPGPPTEAEAETLAGPDGRLAEPDPGLEPEPVRAPVLAASATPPVAKTATDAAMTLAVRSLASGDLIICPLREVVAETR